MHDLFILNKYLCLSFAECHWCHLSVLRRPEKKLLVLEDGESGKVWSVRWYVEVEDLVVFISLVC